MKPELDNISIRRQEQNNTMSQHQFIKTEGGEGVSNMPSLSPLGGADINLTASSPATEALELLNDDPNVMFDLNEMLRRDPTLSSLVKEEPGTTNNAAFAPHPQPQFGGGQIPQHILIEQAAVVNRGGMPIPSSRRDMEAGGGQAASASLGSSQPFGDGSSAGSTNMGTSPGLQPAAPMAVQVAVQPVLQLQPAQQQQMQQQQLQPEVKMDTMDALQPTLAQLNSPGSNENSLMSMKVEHDFDVDFNDYFTNSGSRDVSFGLGFNNKPVSAAAAPQRGQQPVAPATAAAIRLQIARNNVQQQQQQQQPQPMPFSLSPQPPSTVAAGEELLFTNSSFTTHTGGAIFSSGGGQQQSTMSSSVPVTSVLVSSPLQDILNDLPPTSPPEAASNPSAGGLSPSQAGPDRSHGANSTLHKLLLTKRNDPVGMGSRPSPVRSPEQNKNHKTLEKLRSSLSASNPLLSQQLSRSAPMATPGQQQLERALWARREPRQHISSVCSVGEGSGSIADEVSEALSGISPNDLPDIESDDEDEEDTSQNDGTQEDESDEEEDGAGSSVGKSSGGKKERFFWQYNVQAKGPKGQKIVVETKMEDPHVLNDIVDPVFSGDVQLQGIKHSGKARRGDGNDLTADPRKLAAIGKELDQLGVVINDLTPVSEMPFNARCKSRKEKNKLASRACRLKKKAQHEANKLKCMGLAEEHQLLVEKIERAREILRSKIDPNNTQPQAELSDEMEFMARKAQKHLVAGKTTDYVNKMIEKHMK